MLDLKFNPACIEAGCDEAGRGCLAGPVFAAAVILPDDFTNELLNDSKQLSARQRDKLRYVIETEAAAWAVASVDNHKIDEINILNASIAAMHLALDQLTLRPQHIIVDGNRFKKYADIPHTCVVKGDGKYMSIENLDRRFPVYNWKQNKGYPTQEHRDKIKEFGITDFHRKSFNLADSQLELRFNE